MSLISDFELAWKPFEDKVLSYIARNTSKGEITDKDDLNAFYVRTIRMWEDPSKTQAGFLSKWKSKTPELEAAFMKILKEFEFQEPESIEKPNSIPYIIDTLIVTIAGGIVGFFIPKTSFLKVHLGNIPVIAIAVIIFSIVGGGIIKSLYEAALSKSCRDVSKQYNEQLEKLHAKLRDSCKHVS